MATGGTNLFAGLRPKTAPHLLPDANASVAMDVYLQDGHLTALKNKQSDGSFPITPQTIYKWKNNELWLAWETAVHVALPVNPNVNRIYFTGDGVPKVGLVGTTAGTIFYENAGYPLTYPYPHGDGVFTLGVPPCATAPTLAVVDMEPDPDRDYTTLDLETRYYLVTQVNEWNEESGVGLDGNSEALVSARLDVYDDSTVNVTLVPELASGAGYKPINRLRIYRTNTGTQTTGWQFVKEVTLAQALAGPILDDRKSSELAEVAETLEWAVPPVDLTHLTQVAGQFYAGLSGDMLCMSEVLIPYAWPLAYRFPVDDKPVALIANGADVVVLTNGRPVVYVGNAPQAMQPLRISDYQPCRSADSVIVHDGMVMYASPDGLIGISSSQGFRNMTEEILTREQWGALHPATMKVTTWERYVYITSDTGNYLFDLTNKSYTPISVAFDTAFYDGYGDRLYITQGANRYKFAAGAPLTYTWQSKFYQTPSATYATARVFAILGYTNTIFEYYVNGALLLRRKVTDSGPFRLPDRRGQVMTFRVIGSDPVRSASIATSQGELIL